MATCYVNNFGDGSDGLTEETGFRSIAAAVAAGFHGADNQIIVKGWFNEHIPNPPSSIIRVKAEKLGDAIFNGEGKTYFLGTTSSRTPSIIENLIIENFPKINVGGLTLRDDEFKKCIIRHINNINLFYYSPSDSVDEPELQQFSLCYHSSLKTASITIIKNNITLHNYNVGFYNNTYSYPREIIISQGNITFGIAMAFRYCLFINNSFKFIGGSTGNDETEFVAPTGADDAEKIENLRNRMSTVYGGASSEYLVGCKYYSGSYHDIFIDADNGDFSLVPNCLAAHMSYEGEYIGARPEGVTAKIATNFTTSTNIDGNGNITDQNTDAIAITGIQRIGYTRKIKSLNLLGQLAKRNGQSANIEADLGADITPGANKLAAGKVYQAHGDVVIIDNAPSTSLNPFETYYAVDEGGGAGLGFSGNGALKEVFTDKYDEKIQLKVSTDDGTLASANLITCFVHRDSGYVMVNYDGNGKPLYGDADAGFDEATAEILVADWWQAFITIKANNLTAR